MQKYKESLFRFNLMCLYIFLLYQTLTGMILHVDLRGRIVSLTIIICVLYNWKNNILWKHLITSKPIIIWGIWCIFSTINVLIHGHKIYKVANGSFIHWDDDIFYIQIIFRQLIVMVTVCWLYIQNEKRLTLF